MPKGTVLYFSFEDDAGMTIRPRFEYLGGDSTQFVYYDRPFWLDASGIASVEKMIEKHRPTLVVFDTLMNYLGGSTDVFRSNQVADVLSAFMAIAKKYAIAVIGVRHFTKGSSAASAVI